MGRVKASMPDPDEQDDNGHDDYERWADEYLRDVRSPLDTRGYSESLALVAVHETPAGDVDEPRHWQSCSRSALLGMFQGECDRRLPDAPTGTEHPASEGEK